jgi:hypothetical protein
VKASVEPSAEQLVARYRKLAQALDALAARDLEAAAPLRQRYFAIPLSDALRRPALRTEVAAAMAALEASVARASRR